MGEWLLGLVPQTRAEQSRGEPDGNPTQLPAELPQARIPRQPSLSITSMLREIEVGIFYFIFQWLEDGLRVLRSHTPSRKMDEAEAESSPRSLLGRIPLIAPA